MKQDVKYKDPLHEMTLATPTCLWNDSASIQELTYSLEHGAVGATCNPVIVCDVLKKEMHLWKDRIGELIESMPCATEDQIAWKIVEEISKRGAELLEPIFRQHRGINGRLSVQTDPRFYRDSNAIVKQAEQFNALAQNIIVKIPVTKAGIAAIEEATYRGISINATVCFTLPQCISVAEAVEAGLRRREAAGKDISTMGPYAPSWSGVWTIGSKHRPISIQSPRIRDISNGRASPSSRKRTKSFANAAIGFACSRPHSATICTGVNSSEGEWLFRLRTNGR